MSTVNEKSWNSLILDWAFKALGTLVIPLFLWGVSLQITVSELKVEIESNRGLEARVSKLEDNSRKDSIALASMKEKMINVERYLIEIKQGLTSID